MPTPNSESAAPQMLSDRGRWLVPVPWDAGDNLRAALSRLGYPSTLCLNPETREARLELWPGVSPTEFLASLDQLRANPVPPLHRPAPAAAEPADKGPTALPTAQRT